MPELIKLDPAAIKKAEWLAERDEQLVALKAVELVDTDDALKASGKLQTMASKHVKALDKIRKEVKQPALDFGREVDAQAKEMRAEMDAEIERVKKLNGDYATKVAKEAEAERQRIAQEEAARIAKEVEEAAAITPATFGGLALSPEKLETESPAEPAAPLPTGKVHTGANAMVTVWDFEILDPRSIPREYLKIDESLIREHAKYKNKIGETPSIPGVRFTSRVDVRSR